MKQRKTYGYIKFSLESENDLGNCLKCPLLNIEVRPEIDLKNYWCGASQLGIEPNEVAESLEVNTKGVIPMPNWCPAEFAVLNKDRKILI